MQIRGFSVRIFVRIVAGNIRDNIHKFAIRRGWMAQPYEWYPGYTRIFPRDLRRQLKVAPGSVAYYAPADERLRNHPTDGLPM